MQRNPWKFLFLATLAVLIGVLGIQVYLLRTPAAYADSGRFDYIQIVATGFLYNGSQGLLLLDKRNGNVWFLPRGSDTRTSFFKEPVFMIRVPFEKLDEQPR